MNNAIYILHTSFCLFLSDHLNLFITLYLGINFYLKLMSDSSAPYVSNFPLFFVASMQTHTAIVSPSVLLFIFTCISISISISFIFTVINLLSVCLFTHFRNVILKCKQTIEIVSYASHNAIIFYCLIDSCVKRMYPMIVQNCS